MRVPSARVALMLTLVVAAALAGDAGPLDARPTASLRLLNFDLTGKQGALPAVRYAELRSLLLYTHTDIIVLHAARGATARRAGPVQQLARSLGMYCAYLSPRPDGEFGSAVLSRYPFGEAVPVSLGEEHRELVTVGGIQVRAGARPLTVLIMNAVASGDPAATGEAVARAGPGIAELIRANPDGRFAALASLGSEALAQAALEGLGEAGLVDPLSASGGEALTFPAAGPDQRLDFILISANLERAVQGARVLSARGTAGLSQHLPVELTLSY